MGWFNNQKILTKILVLVGFMSFLVAGVGTMGIYAVEHMRDAKQQIDISLRKSTYAGNLAEAVLYANRMEFDLASDFGEKSLHNARMLFENKKRNIRSIIKNMRDLAVSKERPFLDKIEETFDNYTLELDRTIAVAAATVDNARPRKASL
jgi:methyl-accepting chemotaxis protein